MIQADGLSGYVIGCLLIAAAVLILRFVLFAQDKRKIRSSNVAEEARAAGTIPQWPAPPPENDPLNRPPDTIYPILFADGFRMPVNEIYQRGLLPIVDGTGHVVMVVDTALHTNRTVEDWCGLDHGARIS